jgi:hypothetical protein
MERVGIIYSTTDTITLAPSGQPVIPDNTSSYSPAVPPLSQDEAMRELIDTLTKALEVNFYNTLGLMSSNPPTDTDDATLKTWQICIFYI